MKRTISQRELELRVALMRVFGEEVSHIKDLTELICQFQSIWGLTVDGVVGPVTERWLNADRFCAVPDNMAAAGTREKWDNPARPLPIKWIIGTAQNNGYLPTITTQVLTEVYAAAWNQWARVANISPSMAVSLQEAWVAMGSGSLDGPNGTLAWSYLPMGRIDRQLEQRYDTDEPWDTTIVGQPVRGRVSLLAVATHEIGHALGLDHGGRGLMAPYYNEAVLAPQPGYDIDEMRARYGPPVIAPPIPPVPPLPPGPLPPAGSEMLVTINGQRVATNAPVTIQLQPVPTIPAVSDVHVIPA